MIITITIVIKNSDNSQHYIFIVDKWEETAAQSGRVLMVFDNNWLEVFNHLDKMCTCFDGVKIYPVQ